MELRPGDVLPPRNRRVAHPKSRTGCFVCKSRRVKCDERKPSCQRCELLGVECSGYPSQDRKRSERATCPIRPVVQNRRMERSKLCVYKPSSFLHGETATEHRYLSYFATLCEEGKDHITGPFGGPLWTSLILQASHNYEFTRYGLIALGAINKSLERENAAWLTGSKNGALDTSHVAEEQHREFALRLYHKSLKKMREAPLESSHNHNVRRALISSLLIIYFEKFLCNDSAVLRQMVTAQELLEDWFSRNPLTHPGVSTPIPETVEQELVKTFKRLDLQVMHFQDPRGRESHRFQSAYDAQLIENMPIRFSSIEEARHVWDILACRVSHFMIAAGKAPDAISLARIDPSEDLSQWSTLSVLYIYGSPVIHGAESRAQAAIHVREFHNWMASFEHLWIASHAPSFTDMDNRVLAFQLKSSAMYWTAIPDSVCFQSEMEFDAYLPWYHELLGMIRASHGEKTGLMGVLEAMNKRGTAIDLGGAMPIVYVGLRCRDRILRQILFGIVEWLGMNWKGGVMPKPPLIRVLLEVFKWVKGIEEEGLGPEEVVPERNRAALTRLARHKVTNVVMVQCIQRPPGEKPIWHETMFKVSGFGGSEL